MKFNEIRLFWFSMPYMKGHGEENFGDILSKSIVEKVSNKKVIWQNPNNQTLFERTFSTTYFAIGSIIHFATRNCTIWGSGLISSSLSASAPDAKYIAVRGPITRRMLKGRGYKVPEVYGDPGLLTSKYFNYNVAKDSPLGIIPHFIEIEDFNKLGEKIKLPQEIRIIDLRKDTESVLKEILACELILSSSLHGLIIPMSYNIPSYRMVFSNKIKGDGMKYDDYFNSVGILPYTPIPLKADEVDVSFIIREIKRNKKATLIQHNLENIQDDLISVNPF